MLAPQIEKFYFELANPAGHQRALPGPPALLHQHVSQLEAGAPLPLCGAQRRNQHHSRQRQLDERAPVGAREPAAWRQDRQALSGHHPGGSDSASLDNAVEFLYQSGRSLPHVMAMLIPEAWSGNPDMDEEKRAFYEYHASLMEPWDGPAAIAFTDGKVIGATLDRNGLRPGRYIVTKDDLVVLASEAGVLEVPAEDIRKKGRLQPGRMFLVDTVQKRIISDAEIKKQLAAPPALRRAGSRSSRSRSTCCRSPRASSPPIPKRCCAASAPTATAKRICASCLARWAPKARSRSAPWAPMFRWPVSPTARSRCSTTSSSSLRRSPIRPSIPSAKSW